MDSLDVARRSGGCRFQGAPGRHSGGSSSNIVAKLLFLVVTIFAVAAFGETTTPENEQVKKNRLELQKIIKSLQKERLAFGKVKGQERSVLGDVESIDRKLSKGRRNERALQKRLAQVRQKIPLTKKAIATAAIKMAKEKKILVAHIRLMYGLGGRGAAKLALMADSIASLNQGMRYFGYLVGERNRQFERFSTSVAELQKAMAENKSLVSSLEKLGSELVIENKKTKVQLRKRQKFLGKVRKEKGLIAQKVSELKLAKDELVTLVDGLVNQVAIRLQFDKKPEGFGKRRGKLKPPVPAKAKYKKPGLFFLAKESDPVQSIFRGHIVYADWFRGYGQLLIIDHGDHFFSLYGHNSLLLVALGDWVEEGDKIAETGDTGSLRGTGLYFEIRRHGKAVNPRRWLKKG